MMHIETPAVNTISNERSRAGHGLSAEESWSCFYLIATKGCFSLVVVLYADQSALLFSVRFIRGWMKKQQGALVGKRLKLYAAFRNKKGKIIKLMIDTCADYYFSSHWCIIKAMFVSTSI